MNTAPVSHRMIEARSMWVDTFAAFNGGTQKRKWSIGHWDADHAQAEWVELCALPNDASWDAVQAKIAELKAPTAEAPVTVDPRVINTETRDGVTYETRIEFGSAARRNRGRNTGQKVHKLVSEYIVAVDSTASVRLGSYASKFLLTQKPVLFSCHPLCGCTMGQHAGQPYKNLTAENVTCSRC